MLGTSTRRDAPATNARAAGNLALTGSDLIVPLVVLAFACIAVGVAFRLKAR